MKPRSFKMNRMFFFVVLGGLFLVFFILTSIKEGFTLSGSWSKSCKEKGNDIKSHLPSANCESSVGGLKKNISFNYGNCPYYQVGNNNGRLECEIVKRSPSFLY